MPARGMTNTGDSTYHALEVELRRRMSQGLLFHANYTFGRAITDNDGASSTLFTQRPSPVRNPRSTIQDIAPRQQFNANWIYELPLGQGKAFAPQSGIWRKVLEGWQTTGLIKFRTGRPLSIRSGIGSFLAASESDENTVNLSQSLSTDELRNLTGLQDSGSSVVWFDPCMSVVRQEANVTCTDSNAIPGLFTYPNLGQIGQLKQTPIFGPNRFLLDFGLIKRTNVTETVEVEFRLEVFNLTNTPNFDIPENRIKEDDFGKILDTITDPRVMQFALKINF